MLINVIGYIFFRRLNMENEKNKKLNRALTKFGGFLVGAVIVVAGLAGIWEKWFEGIISLTIYSVSVIILILLLLIFYLLGIYRSGAKKFLKGLKYIVYLEEMYKHYKKSKSGK